MFAICGNKFFHAVNFDPIKFLRQKKKWVCEAYKTSSMVVCLNLTILYEQGYYSHIVTSANLSILP
jgi:hypothetical protein